MSELHYTYRVEWSPEDEEWAGLVAEFPSLSWLDPDPVEAMRGIRDLVVDVVADMRAEGETVPEPLAERRYSGKVFVRTSPELHRRLTIEAAEQGVSVNQWAMQKLAEREGDALLPVVLRIFNATGEQLQHVRLRTALEHIAAARDDGNVLRALLAAGWEVHEPPAAGGSHEPPVEQRRKPRKAAAR